MGFNSEFKGLKTELTDISHVERK